MPNTKLMRSENDRVLGGVCGGIAVYLEIDPVLVRVAFLVLLFASGIGLPMYLILWAVMPKASYNDQAGPVVQDNLKEMGDTFINKMGSPSALGIVLILLGGYFLLNQWGFWGGVIWPLLVIGIGAYILTRRK